MSVLVHKLSGKVRDVVGAACYTEWVGNIPHAEISMRYFTIVLVLLLVGCDEGGGPLGDPVLQVVSGNEQIAPAPADSTEEPVVARLGRGAPGGITSRLFVTPLYAQAIVQGIAGEQVCGVGIGDNPMAMWNTCATTDAAGEATFYPDPPCTVGTAMTEIRAVVDGQKVVTDTVIVEVEAGPATETFAIAANQFHGQDELSMADKVYHALADDCGNEIPWRFEYSGPIAHVAGTELGSDAAMTLVADTFGIDSVSVVTAQGLHARGQLEVYQDSTIIDDYPDHVFLRLLFPE